VECFRQSESENKGLDSFKSLFQKLFLSAPFSHSKFRVIHTTKRIENWPRPIINLVQKGRKIPGNIPPAVHKKAHSGPIFNAYSTIKK
jgi:hypothetical protein